MSNKNIDKKVLFEERLKKHGLEDFAVIGEPSNNSVKLLHNKCGSYTETNPHNFFRRKIKCKTCHKREINLEFKNFLDEKFNNELKLTGFYSGLRKNIEIRHLKCGKTFYKTPEFLKEVNDIREVCECYKITDKLNESDIARNNRLFDNKLIIKGLIDYKRKSDYIDAFTDITIYHTTCQREFKIKPTNFMRRKYKCVHCSNPKKVQKSRPKNEYYQSRIDEMTNGEFKLLSNYYNLNSYVKLKHLKCGHVFEVRADNFGANKEKCPKCADREILYNKSINEKIKYIESILNNEFEVMDKYFTYDDYVTLRHKKCGTELKCRASSIYKSKHKKIFTCKTCDYENRKDEFLDRLNRIQGDNFTLRGKYRGVNTATLFRHKECGGIFKYTPTAMLKKKYEDCPLCREKKKREQLDLKIKDYYNGEYILEGEYSSSQITLLHKECGSKFKVYNYQLYKNKNLCKCTKKKK